MDEPLTPIVAAMTRRLVALFQPELIYLFGSQARGDAGPGSDYDFLVVVPMVATSAYECAVEAQRALAPFPVAKDVLVWSRDEFERRLHLPASLPATVAREGRLVYER